jgi:hypothetical protein
MEHVVVSRRSSHCHSSSENPNPTPPERKTTTCVVSSSPNKLSEELVRLMVTIFHKLNKTTTTTDAAAELELSGTSSSSKLNISSCIGPRSLVPKVSVSVNGAAAAAMSPLKNRRAALTKGGGAEKEAAAAGTGCQKRFVEFTRASVDVTRVSLCLVDIKNLR